MNMRFAAGCLVLALSSWTTCALAHGHSRVLRELKSEGYERIEISGKKAPFDVTACLNDDRMQFQIDYYGAKSEETRIGSCNESVAETPVAETTKPAATVVKSKPGKAVGCVRYVAAIGATVPVACP